MKTYIHYGSKEFLKDKVSPIKNEKYFSKPKGGLWASPLDTNMGWRDWCKSEDFRECNEENSFTFALADAARVLSIKQSSDLNDLPKIETDYFNKMYLDFEELTKQYDAIEVSISSSYDLDGDWHETLYYKLYGWDCDSILIMNPDIVEDVKEGVYF